MRRVDLIPFSCGAGASTLGCAQGPAVLQKLRIENALTSEGFEAGWKPFFHSAFDGGENTPRGSQERFDIVVDHIAHLSDSVVESVQNGGLPVCIGGDHSMAIGSIAGIAKAYDAYGQVGVLWIDAHLDAHTHETSPSQSIHGMPVAHLLGLGDSRLNTIGSAKPKISPEHLCYIGARDFESEEHKLLKDMGVRIFYMDDVRRLGMKNVVEQAIDIITQGTKATFLSFDIDGLDPEVAPAVGTPVEQGISEEDMLLMLDILSERVSLAGMELAEYNPSLDREGKTASLIYRTLPKLVAQEKKIASMPTGSVKVANLF